jgi:hypothetical protein
MSCSSSGLLTTCLIGLSVAACVLRILAMVLPVIEKGNARFL